MKRGARYGFEGDVFITETQKTRTGNDGEGGRTRPYRYGEFDILAVSMQPSTGDWNRYMYTLGRWLVPGEGENEIATFQPVSMTPNDFWTDDFETAAKWFRVEDGAKRMAMVPTRTQSSRKKRAKAAGNGTPKLL
ncbi:MAG: hypothetical protein Kow00114_10010 [Kiloniellaceae bacterium]